METEPPYLITTDDDVTLLTTQETLQEDHQEISVLFLIFKIVILGSLIVCGVVGNTLVVISVFKFRTLRIVANYFIVSLAAADLMVSFLVMPMALHQEITQGHWKLGAGICDLWVAVDVLTCTSSIWNLCSISVDRFLAINHPIQYAIRRTPTMAAIVIISMWLFCFMISIPALVAVGGFDESKGQGECALNVSPIFQISSSMLSFYFPCFILLFVYYKIYRSVQALSKRRPGEKVPDKKRVLRENASKVETLTTKVDTMASHVDQMDTLKVHTQPNGSGSSCMSELPHTEATSQQPTKSISKRTGHQTTKRISVAKERRATSVLAIVVTVFICCWLPFFITNVLIGIGCNITFQTFNAVTWLGWANSAANPLIYTIFNREFRHAFRKILTCRINQHSPYNKRF
ncbi:Alpha-2A adrenergic receptor [Holothuria leucospilota]|uniref:Alpha-2A adrenergic receptor n=1 Tax=Holothuria leucospilota TaxID=206669 RepID=A0A9Q1BFM7_HOLLE|nr:Alpha-2A adrenergic receptor [Holothuria leucospilota]